MKITAIKASNFLGARAVDVQLTKPVTLFVGHNYAGKSSVQEAVRMALTGESVRVALKKDYGALITEGEASGFVEVTTAEETFSVVLPSGKGNHCDHPALPYVLNAQRFASLAPNERRSFLFGLMGVKMDGASVKERLLKRECDHHKVEVITPFLRAGFDAAHKEAQAKARECKAQWKTTTGGETYGEKKAAAWTADKPAVDTAALDQASADLVETENEIEAETVNIGAMQAAAHQHGDQQNRLAGLRQKASMYARIADKLARDEADLKTWEVKVEETRASAAGGLHEAHHECPGCGCALQIKGVGLFSQLIKYTPPEVQTDADAKAKLPEYEKTLATFRSMVANGKRDLTEADEAANAIKELEGESLIKTPSKDEIEALRTRIETLKASKRTQQAIIDELQNAITLAAEADVKTARAATLHQDVMQWDVIAAALAPDGIPGEMLAEALNPLNNALTMYAGIAGWSNVSVTPEMAIAYGDRAYSLLSESEQWRVDALIACAISVLSGVKLLVLDRFDVLDLQGRDDLIYWLTAIAEDGDIDTALVFGTLKALPSQLPDSIGAIWIEIGVAGQQMKEVA